MKDCRMVKSDDHHSGMELLDHKKVSLLMISDKFNQYARSKFTT